MRLRSGFSGERVSLSIEAVSRVPVEVADEAIEDFRGGKRFSVSVSFKLEEPLYC